MSLLKIITMTLIMLILGGLTIAASSCTEAATTAPKTQTVAVQRGNLTVDITGVGNLALSQKEDLAFEIPGTVAEVLVKEGDTVAQGQVLARLDTSDWETQLSALEDKVTAAERQLTAKKRALTLAERQPEAKRDAVAAAERLLAAKKDAVAAAERLLAAKKRAVVQAEKNLGDAQTALETTQVTYTVADFIAAQAAVNDAKEELDKAIRTLLQYVPGTEGYRIKEDLVISAQAKLKTAQAKLDDMLSGFAEELAKNQQQVDNAQWNLEDAQIAVADTEKGIEDALVAMKNVEKDIRNAQLAVEDAQLAVADAQLAVEDAQKGLDDAQRALDDAKSDHPEIIAPSAGFITKVNVIGGDEVKKGTVAMTLADPNKFEADILVNETDILQTKLGGNASVQVEAMPGLSLPAKVTHISPTAVIQSGVVNYKVKVEIESLPSVMQARQPVMGNIASGNVTSGAPSGGFRQPFGSGNLTQEQIEEMRRQRQQVQAAPPALPAILSSDIQLREGQTVTVSILVAERNNVLLVPNGAITRRGMESIVKVLKDGVIEERPITTGISNWQYTEVSGGLSEGETVVIPQTTTTTPTTPQQGGMRLPGMGGFGR